MNTPFLQGSNFPTGFTAGNFTLPNQMNPGVPVGITLPYTINPVNEEVFLSTAVNLIKGLQFLPLSGATHGTIRPISDSEVALFFDFARGISVEISDFDGTGSFDVDISYIDMYGQPGIFQATFDDNTTEPHYLIAVYGISSIFVNSTAPISATLTFSTTNAFELPFTDLGVTSQLLGVYKNDTFDNKQTPHIRTTNENAPFVFQWDGDYFSAMSPDTPATLTTSNVRPVFDIRLLGEPITLGNFIFTFLQNVYGIGHGTQFVNQTMPQVGTLTYDRKYVYGNPNYTVGYAAWRG